MRRTMIVMFFLWTATFPGQSFAQGWQNITPPGLSTISFFKPLEFHDGSFGLYIWGYDKGYVTNASLLWDSIRVVIPSPCFWFGITRLVDVARPYLQPNTVISSYLDAGGCSIECYLFLYRDTSGHINSQNVVGAYDDFLCAGTHTRVTFSRFNPNKCYFTFYDSVYHSSDGGRTFRSISAPGPQPYEPLPFFALSPHDSTIAFTANFNRTYRSSDQGYTWTQVLSAVTSVMEFHPTNQNIVYALIDSSVYRSTNAGGSWSLLAPGPFISLEINKENPNILFAGTMNGQLCRSTDAGGSWILYNNTFTTTPLLGLHHLLGDTVLVAASNGVFKVYAPFTLDVGESPGAPLEFELLQNYPNPFNLTTRIPYSVRGVGLVSLRVYDVLGREVATLVNEKLNPGTYTREWNARGMPSGVYFCRMTSGTLVQTRALILAK
jgi:hypothetical protein